MTRLPLTCSQNCRTAPCVSPLARREVTASYALTSVSRSDRAQANDSLALAGQSRFQDDDAHFLLSSLFSMGEVNNGFDERMAAIVRTVVRTRRNHNGFAYWGRDI